MQEILEVIDSYGIDTVVLALITQTIQRLFLANVSEFII